MTPTISSSHSEVCDSLLCRALNWPAGGLGHPWRVTLSPCHSRHAGRGQAACCVFPAGLTGSWLTCMAAGQGMATPTALSFQGAWLLLLRVPPPTSVDPKRPNLSPSCSVPQSLSFKNYIYNILLYYDLVFHKLDYDFYLNAFILKGNNISIPYNTCNKWEVTMK